MVFYKFNKWLKIVWIYLCNLSKVIFERALQHTDLPQGNILYLAPTHRYTDGKIFVTDTQIQMLVFVEYLGSVWKMMNLILQIVLINSQCVIWWERKYLRNNNFHKNYRNWGYPGCSDRYRIIVTVLECSDIMSAI